MNPSLERYRKQLERITQTNIDNLTPVILGIAKQYSLYGKDAKLKKKLQNLLKLLRLQSYMAYLEVWELSALFQSKILKKQIKGTLLEFTGISAALAYAPIVVRRAQVVLAKQKDPLAYAPGYATMIGNITTSLASKKGFDDAGSYHQAKYKTFARVARVEEPRDHSRLEGRTIRANAKWTIAGYEVDSPGDVALPLSERIFCKHINVYSLTK